MILHSVKSKGFAAIVKTAAEFWSADASQAQGVYLVTENRSKIRILTVAFGGHIVHFDHRVYIQ